MANRKWTNENSVAVICFNFDKLRLHLTEE